MNPGGHSGLGRQFSGGNKTEEDHTQRLCLSQHVQTVSGTGKRMQAAPCSFQNKTQQHASGHVTLWRSCVMLFFIMSAAFTITPRISNININIEVYRESVLETLYVDLRVTNLDGHLKSHFLRLCFAPHTIQWIFVNFLFFSRSEKVKRDPSCPS